MWLNVSKNIDVIKLIRKSKQKRFFETIERIIISEYLKNSEEVWLEIWSKNLIDSIKGKKRYNVFYLKSKLNPNWVYEINTKKTN
jgi:hypothetical protein